MGFLSRKNNDFGFSLVQLMVISSIVVVSGMAILQMTENITKRQKNQTDDEAFRSTMDEIALALSVQNSNRLCASALVSSNVNGFDAENVSLDSIRWPKNGPTIIQSGGVLSRASSWKVSSIAINLPTSLSSGLINDGTRSIKVSRKQANLEVVFSRANANQFLGKVSATRTLPISLIIDSDGVVAPNRLYDCYSNYSQAAACNYFFDGNFNDSEPSLPKCKISQLSSDGDLYLRAGSSTSTASFYLSDTGRVGLGTTSPTAILHVNGSVFINGNVTVKGNLSSTGPLTVQNEAKFLDDTTVTGSLTLSGGLKIGGNLIQSTSGKTFTAKAPISVRGDASYSSLTASGIVGFSSDLTVGGGYSNTNASNSMNASDILSYGAIQSRNVTAKGFVQAGASCTVGTYVGSSGNVIASSQCPSGQFATSIGTNGSLTCGAPQVYPQPITCNPGEFLNSIKSDGTLGCAHEMNPALSSVSCGPNQYPKWNNLTATWTCQTVVLPQGYQFECKETGSKREAWYDPSSTCTSWTGSSPGSCKNGCTISVGTTPFADFPTPVSCSSKVSSGVYKADDCARTVYRYRYQNWCQVRSGNDTCSDRFGSEYTCVSVADKAGLGNLSVTCDSGSPSVPGVMPPGITQDRIQCCRVVRK